MERGKQMADLQRLLRARSLDLGTWKRVWTEAGCASGIIEDMSPDQLVAVTEKVERIPTIKRAS